jgi:hypothetical protein
LCPDADGDGEDVNPAVLSSVFLIVMAGALACFVRAYALRRHEGPHRTAAMLGAAIDVFGTVAVIVTVRGLGWHVPTGFPGVALVHRAFAYLSTATLAIQVATGAARHPIHRRLGLPFLGIYTVTYALAVWAYAPWW